MLAVSGMVTNIEYSLMSRNFSANVSTNSPIKHLAQPLRSHSWRLGTLGQLLKKKKTFSAQNMHSRILPFLLLRSPCKISELYDDPFWGFHVQGEEERGYIAGRARLYFCNENSALPKLLAGRTHFCSDQWLSFNIDFEAVWNKNCNPPYSSSCGIKQV